MIAQACNVIVLFDSPFVVEHHGMYVSRSFLVIGNKLNLDIVLGSGVDLYTVIYTWQSVLYTIYRTYHIKGMTS